MKPLFFHSCGEPFGYPTAPPNSTGEICDDRLLGLSALTKVELFGSQPGRACLAKMRRKRGFVFSDEIGMWVEDEPKLTLPTLAGNFSYVLVAGGDAPESWKFLAAPVSGVYLLQCQDGVFSLVDGTNTVAITAICSASAVAAIIPAGCSPDGFRKLALSANRVLVGITGGDSVIRMQSLPDATALQHPRASFDISGFKTIQEINDDGSDVVGGLPVMPVSGGDAITDAVPCLFSPTTKKLYRAPARVTHYSSLNTASSNVPAPTSYGNLPGGHGLMSGAETFNYPKALITATVGFGGLDEQVNLACFRDGVLLHEFTMGQVQNATLVYLDKTIPLGSHTYDIRWKKDPGSTSPSAIVRYSDITVVTLV